MMERLKDGEIDILVSTTVIEVGIDIPNATVMLVEQAERFGLAQLHQLRGRIGRGSEQSFCFLVGAPKSQEAKARMKAMIETNDGFKIAEADLKLRGPGEMLGLRQSGLPNFRVADIIRDDKIMLQARAEAADFLAKDPAGARNCWDSERYKVEDSPRESGSAAIN
jgi:ATP-dependent DNA helicase RecG